MYLVSGVLCFYIGAIVGAASVCKVESDVGTYLAIFLNIVPSISIIISWKYLGMLQSDKHVTLGIV